MYLKDIQGLDDKTQQITTWANASFCSSLFITQWKQSDKFFKGGGSPGLVVMGGEPCSRGRGFESQHRILDRSFSHLFAVKFCSCLKKKPALAHFEISLQGLKSK